MKESKVSQLQSWELFKVDFTAKPTYLEQKLFEGITLLYGRLEDCIGKADVTEQKMLQVAECNRKHQVFIDEIKDQLKQLEPMDDELTKRMQSITHYKTKLIQLMINLIKR